MTEPKHIVFLTGFMGSGKSTIGPDLAKKIGYDFLDIDTIIEVEESKTIAEIFKDVGEEYFRKTEQKILSGLSGSDRKIVVALGGGTLTTEGNRKLILSKGVLVYLKTSRQKILQRVRTKRDRPMLLGPDGNTLDDAALSARVESMLKVREAHYLDASIIIDTSHVTVSKSVEEIASKLKGLIE